LKAIVKKYAKEGLWMESVPMPEIGIDDVLIKVLKTAICGTDVHIWKWDAWAQKNIPIPITVGHEFVGLIEEVGSNVRGYTVGELVSGEGHIVCGHCRNCLAGRRHLCTDTLGVGVNFPGAFAEYIALPATNVWRADTNIDTDILACFDPFGNAVHSALTYDLVGEDVLITGAGPIGIMATAIAKHCGARNVIVTDVNPLRLDLAKRMGADATVDVRTESLDDIMKKSGIKVGFDVGLEMSGNVAAFEKMIEHLIHGGKIALLGILPSGTGIDWEKIVFNSITIKGIYGRLMFETWYKMTVLIQGGLDISPVITHRLSADDFQEGFDLMMSGKSGKVILTWS